MPKITNERYNQFLKTGTIRPIDPEELDVLLKKIKTKYAEEARQLIIILYYTGCRPAEALNLVAEDIRKEKNYIIITTTALKNGLTRQIRISLSRRHITELYKYCMGRPENMYLFPHFRSNTTRQNTYTTKSGERKIKTYNYVSNGLTYHFNKWFEGELNPYFFRHNRFSKLMEAGASAEDIMILKGAKSMESVRPYLHMSKQKIIAIAKRIR